LLIHVVTSDVLLFGLPIAIFIKEILQRNPYLFIQSLTHAYSSIYSPEVRTLLIQQIQIKHTL